MKKKVVIGFLGTHLDVGGKNRWSHWRPTISIGQQEDLLINRFELFYNGNFESEAAQVKKDFQQVSPETKFHTQKLEIGDPWDFVTVFNGLFDFFKTYPFDPDNEEYLVHISTGTHVIQICLFLLTEAHIIPGKLIQTSMAKSGDPIGKYVIIDLDLSKYDKIAERFNREQESGIHFLKSGIQTRDAGFNELVRQLSIVSVKSDAPILLTGPTGVGKTRMARLIFEWKKQKHMVSGSFVELNCATLKGNACMSALFGHVKGAFTGAIEKRTGLLKAADGGLLFLDEIGELGIDEQAMLLRALEEGKYYPMGSDVEVSSRFQLICGTNRDLAQMVAKGDFREDLLSRIQLWTFKMPGLASRKADIEPNIQYELDSLSARLGKRISFNKEALDLFLRNSLSQEALWSSNFRDLSASIVRMATFSTSGRITVKEVEDEWRRLTQQWHQSTKDSRKETKQKDYLECLLPSSYQELDLFDACQLQKVIEICRSSKTLADASRKLFSHSLLEKKSQNHSDRLRKYLAKFGLDWKTVTQDL